MSKILTVEKPRHDLSMMELLSQLRTVDEFKSGSMHIAALYAQLATGQGSISPSDFMTLRLFDKAFNEGADLREFVGDRRMRDICLAVNYRHDWFGMLSDKVASTSYLQAFGLPTIPIRAIYMRGITPGRADMLPDKAALEEFLLREAVYPLFGKPIDSQNSLGSLALASCSVPDREVMMGDGSRASVREIAEEIDSKYAEGYLLQPWVLPHASLAALSGKRIACVRFLTIAAEEGVRVFRACLKIPSGSNAADNYWLSGNLLAGIDLSSGRVLRVTSGSGLDTKEHTEHPDTHQPLVGFIHPQWDEMKALALNAARVMQNVPLIGWDIACTESGPVIVEMNEYPDAFLMQFADRRGLLDDTFKRFIEFQKRNRAAFDAEMKSRYAAM